MDKEIKELLKRVEKDGIAFTKPNRNYKVIPQKTSYSIYYNRRNRETIIIDKNKIKKLLKDIL